MLQNVNILSWFDYIGFADVANEIENTCHVKISYDGYYSNEDFLRRWNNHNRNYDVIIFSDTIYSTVKDELTGVDADLHDLTKNYHPSVKKQFDQIGYLSNVLYFIHAYTVFLWNPNNIAIHEQDDISQIFKNAHDKFVVLVDDPLENHILFKSCVDCDKKSDIDYFTPKNFRLMSQKTKIFTSDNNYAKIFSHRNFAFAYLWSGTALWLQSGHPHLKIMIHPKLTNISTDLLAVTNDRKESICVARFLASKKLLTKIRNESYFFTPYLDISSINSPLLKKITLHLLRHIDHLKWSRLQNVTDFMHLARQWKVIKQSFG